MINRAFEKIHLKFNNYTKEDLFDLFFWLSIYLFFNTVAITLHAIYMLLDFIGTCYFFYSPEILSETGRSISDLVFKTSYSSVVGINEEH